MHYIRNLKWNNNLRKRDFFRWRHTGAHRAHTAAALTETFGCLAAKVHSIQAHGTLRGSHVQSYVKSVGNVVVHALLKTPTKFWRKKNFLNHKSAANYTIKTVKRQPTELEKNTCKSYL